MTGAGALILLVEDEPQMRRFLRVALEGSGYRYLEAGTGQEGLALAVQHRPEAILLDLGLPDMDGLDLVVRLREWSRTPVIVISARGQETDKVGALDAGADDYLTKPFGTRELLARVRVALRHAGPETQQEPVFVLDRWRVDLAKRQVLMDGKEVHLTPLEYSLFTTLIRHARRPEEGGDQQGEGPTEGYVDPRHERLGSRRPQQGERHATQGRTPGQHQEEVARGPQQEPEGCVGAGDEQEDGRLVQAPHPVPGPRSPGGPVVGGRHGQQHDEAQPVDRRPPAGRPGAGSPPENHRRRGGDAGRHQVREAPETGLHPEQRSRGQPWSRRGQEYRTRLGTQWEALRGHGRSPCATRMEKHFLFPEPTC